MKTPVQALLSAALVVLMLSSCASGPTQQAPVEKDHVPVVGADLEPGVQVARRPPRRAAILAPEVKPRKSAAEKLSAQAAVAERQGQYTKAAALLERGLRIAPADASLWHQLARVRLAGGQADRAEALASKSNSLAAGNRLLQRENWRLIATARGQRGDKRGAASAKRQANKL